ISDEGKALLKAEPTTAGGKELEKKFSKELKVEDQDFRPFLSDDERREWDLREKEVKSVEMRKPKALTAALGFADYGVKPRERYCERGLAASFRLGIGSHRERFWGSG